MTISMEKAQEKDEEEEEEEEEEKYEIFAMWGWLVFPQF
jgi:ribosomal protein L12E/L44/L45/RPP1/RPP2